jgi:hypothetical protein
MVEFLLCSFRWIIYPPSNHQLQPIKAPIFALFFKKALHYRLRLDADCRIIIITKRKDEQMNNLMDTRIQQLVTAQNLRKDERAELLKAARANWAKHQDVDLLIAFVKAEVIRMGAK